MQHELLQPGRTTLIDMASGTTPIYLGEANTVQPTFTFTVTSVSTAAAAVITITAHGLSTDNQVIIAGGTGDWAALNGTRAITRTGVNTFTVAVDSSTFASTFAGTITTVAPRTSAACWRISKNYYDATPDLIRSSFAAGAAPNQIWDSRATLLY